MPLAEVSEGGLEKVALSEVSHAGEPASLPAPWHAKLKHWTGLDRAIVFTVTARFWSALAGVVTVLLIARFLTPNEQGYYYTFFSLVALQIVFELGFAFVVMQLAAHESAQLIFGPLGRVGGNPVAHSRLASVLQKAIRWYSVAAIIMAATLLPAGLFFFARNHSAASGVEWKGPWCLLVLAAMLTFQMDPLFAFAEGCGFVPQIALMRLGQALLGSALAWTAMITHHGLYSPALMLVGQATVQVAFLLRSNIGALLKGLLKYPVGLHSVGWRQEIWPFQWRIAITWLSSYFIFQLFNPVLFAYQGPAVAGRMGMSLSIASSIGSVGLAWMSTKASPFGNLVARGEILALDKLFFRTLWQSTVLLLIGAASCLSCLVFIAYRFPSLAMRVLPPWAFGLLLLTTVMNHVVMSEALYLRAHKREPFLIQAVSIAVALGISTVILGRVGGATAVTVGYFAFGGVLSLTLATHIFMTKRKQWHVPSSKISVFGNQSNGGCDQASDVG